ncbi:MAG: hypothetical protein N3A61_03370, partial [Ignavibacteria bacterium]|nr:hypothetical protein [Ignavibacteria bacterium]
PMFAHGQVEGYAEKYGMEYYKAYKDELPNEYLIQRHQNEIFPLMKKRFLFSQVENFEFYDFIDEWGNINQNVFAYSNLARGERAIIFFHNKYEETRGWIKHSRLKIYPRSNGEAPILKSKNLAEALEIKTEEGFYYTFQDFRTKLHFIRSGKELAEKGLFISLKAFEYFIFTDFKELYDETGEYKELASKLNGRGVQSLHDELTLIKLESFHSKIINLFNVNEIQSFKSLIDADDIGSLKLKLSEFNRKLKDSVEIIFSINQKAHIEDISTEVFLEEIKKLKELGTIFSFTKNSLREKLSNEDAESFLKYFDEVLKSGELFKFIFVLKVFALLKIETKENENIFDFMKLDIPLRKLIHQTINEESNVNQYLKLMKVLFDFLKRMESNPSCSLVDLLFFGLKEFKTQEFIKVNEYNQIKYFNKERFELLIVWFYVIFCLSNIDRVMKKGNTLFKKQLLSDIVRTIEDSRASNYKFESFMELIEKLKIKS